MKISIPVRLPFLILFFGCTFSVFAQGTLTPPGAPAPTMKTLDQIQPETPISSLPVTLSASGSYFLTKNLNSTNGSSITISGSGITLDLKGFTISCTAASEVGTAIVIVGAVHDITIKNGHIVSGITFNGSTFTNGPGFFSGISYNDSALSAVSISDLSVSGCGDGGAIALPLTGATIISHCTGTTNAGGGFSAALVENSTAMISGGTAIFGSVVNNCLGDSKNGAGINGTIVTNSYGTATGAHFGIAASFGTVTTSFGSTATGSGISTDIASYSRGQASGAGNGILAVWAIGCSGSAGSGGTAINAAKTFSSP